MDLNMLTVMDQQWATGIIAIPLQKGLLVLVASVHLFSGNVIVRKLRSSFDREFRLEAREMKLDANRQLEISHPAQEC